MAVTVKPIVGGIVTPSVMYPTGTLVDVDFDHLFVYSAPNVVVAAYSKGQWLSAEVS